MRTVRFEESDLSGHELERLRAEAERGQAERETLPGGQVELSEAERRSLDRQHDTWSWQQHGFEAMRAKGALQAEGATEWMDFYEPGEGAAGALANLRRSKERAAQTGAPIGVGGERRERDPDDPLVRKEQAKIRERAVSEECDHARGFCKRGDREACEFLGEACGFSEEEIDELMGLDEAEPEPIEDKETPFTGPQLDALRRSWGGYYGAIREMERALNLINQAETHARESFEAINAIRADAGQDSIQPHRLNEILRTDLADVCNVAASAGQGIPECPDCGEPLAGPDKMETMTQEDGGFRCSACQTPLAWT